MTVKNKMNVDESSCSIVIRCYNEERHIGRLLSGILEQTVKDVEIIVVDSGSTDATLSIASKFPAKILHIKKEDFSFGRALNIGCRVASKEHIVIISAHCYPIYEDWLEKMITPFADSNIALVYGKQRGGETTHFSEHQIFKKWYPDKQSSDSQKHPFCNNANSAIRKALFNKIEFDEELTGLEDLDWGNKIISLNKNIAYSSDAVVVHLHDESAKQIRNRFFRESYALKKVFPEEHFTILDFFKLFFKNTTNDFRVAFYEGKFFFLFLSIINFRLNQFYGTYRGFQIEDRISSELKQHFYYPNSNDKEDILKLETNEKSRKPIKYS